MTDFLLWLLVICRCMGCACLVQAMAGQEPTCSNSCVSGWEEQMEGRCVCVLCMCVCACICCVYMCVCVSEAVTYLFPCGLE